VLVFAIALVLGWMITTDDFLTETVNWTDRGARES
jgi:hypothetical protein